MSYHKGSLTPVLFSPQGGTDYLQDSVSDTWRFQDTVQKTHRALSLLDETFIMALLVSSKDIMGAQIGP